MTNQFKLRPRQEGRHTPNLRPVWLVAPLALLIVGALAYGLYQGADALLTSENTSKKPVSVQDVIKTTITVLTLIGAVLAALYAYRKQLLDEGASHRADATQLAERYAKAAEQLGHDQAAVRLAGVYAMARLADDWPEQRQTCVNVLCAYLRMPYEPDANAAGFIKGEREVRLTVIRTIRDHLQDPTTHTTWCELDLDLTGTVFDGGDFGGSRFTGGTVNFSRSIFSGPVDFGGSRFTDGTVTFSRSIFSGPVDFGGSVFSDGTVDFGGSVFTDGTVDFGGSVFTDGRVSFGGSVFTGGTVDFINSRFSGGAVDFLGSRFSGGTVIFLGSRFSGGAVDFRGSVFSDGTVSFGGSRFSGGTVNFINSRFSGGAVDFRGSVFSDGTVSFRDSTYSRGTVNFSDATFSGGTVEFSGSVFSGSTVNFSDATFSGSTVNFRHSTYSGGTVNFRGLTFSGGAVDFDLARIHAAVTIDWGPFPVLPVNQP
ncbi:pentapeptide repeat-containing protein [Streptomyces sp. NPDC102381]|uniref:pentapeptide repeat-containing protein n=1 Tax=Streptomyces sp. NPDC102381 TaxID=3366164 RepID=UPI003803994E